jgi:hypothetical protein
MKKEDRGGRVTRLILSSLSNYRSDTQMEGRPPMPVEVEADEDPGDVVPGVVDSNRPRILIPPFDQRLPRELAD